MTLPRITLVVLIVLVVAGSGCDKGLQPLNEPSGFSGILRFTNWPPADSVIDLRLVAFETFPSDSAGIIPALLTGEAVFYPTIAYVRGFPTFRDTLHYEFTTQGTNLKVAKYDYVVLVQRYGDNVLTDWRPAGVYTTIPNSFDPSPVRVLLHKVTPDINIDIDFRNLPPRPWR